MRLKAEKPDAILIAGDIIDGSYRHVAESHMAEEFRKLLTLRRGRSCAGPQIMSQPLIKICRTLPVGQHKTGPCVRQTWQEAIIILCTLVQFIFYARQRNFML